ncbi:hypothetical protein EXIGLDRAFT_771854 [Exidia glandulosa HHB12029]|uniref:Uncharacterized protein n=1 Tax=Exidia glandulosa HHB12029 TaxID=1314781 RepID=A0A165FPR3_EXIGL|nr:hypothetical protein EXIGLDRAFT_771854 [Exidia glandulosa HHB12029]
MPPKSTSAPKGTTTSQSTNPFRSASIDTGAPATPAVPTTPQKARLFPATRCMRQLTYLQITASKGKAPASGGPARNAAMDIDLDDVLSGSETISQSSTPPPNASLLRSTDGLDYTDVKIEERLETGFYNFVIEKVDQLGRGALSNLDVTQDLDWNASSHQFRAKNSKHEAVFYGVGEIKSAQVNAYGTKPEGREINDFTNVRGGLSLQEATGWDAEKLGGAMLVQEQIYNLSKAMERAEGGPAKLKAVAAQAVKDTRYKFLPPCKKSAIDVKGYDILPIVTEFFYTTKPPPAAVDLDVEQSPRKRKAAEASSSSAARLPAVGDQYDATLMTGYNGWDFKFKDAKLVQLDIRDVNGALIQPWDWHLHLTPKTLVSFRARLKRWVVSPSDKNGNTKSTIYQVVAESIRVLAKGEPKTDHNKEDEDADAVVLDENMVYLEDYEVVDPFALPSPSKKAKTA